MRQASSSGKRAAALVYSLPVDEAVDGRHAVLRERRQERGDYGLFLRRRLGGARGNTDWKVVDRDGQLDHFRRAERARFLATGGLGLVSSPQPWQPPASSEKAHTASAMAARARPRMKSGEGPGAVIVQDGA